MVDMTAPSWRPEQLINFSGLQILSHITCSTDANDEHWEMVLLTALFQLFSVSSALFKIFVYITVSILVMMIS